MGAAARPVCPRGDCLVTGLKAAARALQLMRGMPCKRSTGIHCMFTETDWAILYLG